EGTGREARWVSFGFDETGERWASGWVSPNLGLRRTYRVYVGGRAEVVDELRQRVEAPEFEVDPVEPKAGSANVKAAIDGADAGVVAMAPVSSLYSNIEFGWLVERLRRDARFVAIAVTSGNKPPPVEPELSKL